MTLTSARKILGIGPEEDPRLHLAEIKNAREAIAAMVRTAPNETLAARYQAGLIEFDQALAAVQEHLEASGLAAPPLPPQALQESAPAASPTTVTTTASYDLEMEALAPYPDPPRSRALSYFIWFLIFFIGAAGGAWLYIKSEQSKSDQRLIRIAFLEKQGSVLVENRRWQEAAAAFSEIEALAPSSDIVVRGRRSIEAGMTEEQTQFIGYWTGQAAAELEAGRLDQAYAAARQVLDKYPTEKDAAALLEKVAAARVGQSRTTAIAAAREAIDQRKWDAAIATARQILAATPDDPDAKSLLADATAGAEKTAADHARATLLLKQATARDNGQFDQQALDWLREAKSLDPGNPEITARLEKLAAYTRTLHVPGDFATPAEALAAAHDNDRIVLAAATWTGPLVITAAVELQGSGFATTTVECAPETGPAISIGPDAKGVRISGIRFRHTAFALGPDRFSAALVRGGSVTFVDCRFTDASGHGLAVIESGHATVTRSRFADNGWDGAAAFGKGSSLEIRESEALNNFQHGIESWDGAALTLANNRCEANSRNGIHADCGPAPAIIEGNQLIANREFGLVLDSASSGKISTNLARANLLGGYVIRTAAAKLPVAANQATLNQGPGLVLEKGLPPAAYTSVTLTQNSEPQLLANADLTADATVPNTPDPAPAATVIAPPKPAPIKPKLKHR